ncbi:PD-(D/E)XK motif protein [Alcaligenaceae bacterium B3P038]|nr:PD-(D/E)XK motif protein [Alcaligenaceae bacterium B3P038]
MSENLDERWDGLQSDGITDIFQLVDPQHPLSWYLGKTVAGKRTLLLVANGTIKYSSTFSSVETKAFKRLDGKWCLLLTLSTEDLNEIFALMCKDLMDISLPFAGSEQQSVARTLARLSRWQRLFTKRHLVLLSEEARRGLCGELIFLLRLGAKFGLPAMIDIWKGPLGSHQDFQSLAIAWEVKTRRPAAEFITISSEHQLDSAERLLRLIVIELSEVKEGTEESFTLNSLVNRVRLNIANHSEASERFEECLSEAGYIERREYDLPTLVETETVGFSVDEDFPRIVATDCRNGVFEVTYRLRLEACKAFQITDYFAE